MLEGVKTAAVFLRLRARPAAAERARSSQDGNSETYSKAAMGIPAHGRLGGVVLSHCD